MIKDVTCEPYIIENDDGEVLFSTKNELEAKQMYSTCLAELENVKLYKITKELITYE